MSLKIILPAIRNLLIALAVICLAFQPTAAAAGKKITDVSERYLEAVNYLTSNNLANGVSESKFGVDHQIERGNAAIILANALGMSDTDAPPSGFNDVPTRGVDAVNALKQAGIINGKSPTSFGFNDLLTRGEIALMLADPSAYNLKGNTLSLPFTDVNARYKDAVAALASNGVTNGKSATEFGTNDPLTRGAFAIFIYKAEMIGTGPSSSIIAFGDSNTSGSYLPREFPEYPAHNWPALMGIKNAGISGNTTESALKRFEEDILSHHPSTVVMMFGINDALIRSDTLKPQVSKAQFEANLSNMVDEMESRNIQVVLMTNIPVVENIYYQSQFSTNPGIEQLYTSKGGLRNWADSYNDIIRNVAKNKGVYLIDNYRNAIQKSGGATDLLLSQSGLIDPLLGIHWTPRGHMMVHYSVDYALNQ